MTADDAPDLLRRESPPCLRGLFVGVNRYASSRIPTLASAVRDADAVHALFEDNLGGTNVKLLDAAATRDRLVEELDTLVATSGPDDIVVITFSGHGTDTHELVTYDADPFDFSGSCLSLEELTDRVSAIPARQLLVVLDCCFSGGAGAKVLHASLIPRGTAGHGSLLSTDALLDQMAGTSRLILTASTAEQPAYEDPVVGHGLLTYHLLQALLGPDEVAERGRVPIYALLAYVTTNVIATASGTMVARQEPTLRGQMDGALTWPIFTPGPLYQDLFPQRSTTPVTADIQSLKGHGIADAVLDRWAESLPGLNDLQQAVINDTGLLAGKNVLVSAPTSSGKTMLGELAALGASQRGGRSVFLLPTRALVNEQYARFTRMYEDLGIRVLRVTGEISDQLPEFVRGQFDIALLTYEKFTGLALASSHILQLVSVIVVDEVQTLVDTGRGPWLELLLTAIKARRNDGIAPQLVCLSAVLGDLGGLDSWLEAQALRWTKRPVSLTEGLLRADGSFRFLDDDGEERQEQLLPPHYRQRAQDFLIPLVRTLVAAGQQVIVFRNQRGSARGSAGYLAGALGLPAADDAIDALPTGDPNVISQELRRCLRGGVAFHVSDLERDEKRIIEETFRQPDSSIRVIVATTTLAQGVNLPAETVVISELAHPQGLNKFTPYTTAEYKNIAGRAGRLGLTDAGRAIVLTYGAADEHSKWTRYIMGTPEDVTSSLLGVYVDLYTLTLRVVSIASARSGGGITAHDALAVLANTFASHQARLTSAADPFEPTNVIAVLDELRTQEFVTETPDGRLALSSLGRLVAHSALSVRSALNVTAALRAIPYDQLNRATVITITQLTEEVDQLLFPVHYKGYRTEMRTFGAALAHQGAAPAAIQRLSAHPQNEPSRPARRAKKAVACLLWMTGTPAAQFEPFLTQHVRERDIIGPVRAVTSRMRDVTDTVIAIAREIHPPADLILGQLAELLPVQLELGVPAEAVPLARIAGAALSRQTYLDLAARGYASPQAILDASIEDLMPCVGEDADAATRLRQWADLASSNSEAVPTLDELLPPPVD